MNNTQKEAIKDIFKAAYKVRGKSGLKESLDKLITISDYEPLYLFEIYEQVLFERYVYKLKI